MDEERTACALVVDDNVTVLMMAADILEDVGFRTYTANDAEEAVRSMEVEGQGVDLLFTDVEMPGAMDGFALARLVDLRWPHVRILVASGRARPQTGDLPAGSLFVGKPFSAHLVHERVDDLLEHRRKPSLLLRRFLGGRAEER